MGRAKDILLIITIISLKNNIIANPIIPFIILEVRATDQFRGDSDVLQKIMAGDETAFRIFYDKNFDRIAKYTFKICKSESVTEEIVQDVFLKLWSNRLSIGHVRDIEAYLFSIARNKTIDFLRRLAKETAIIQTLSTQLTEVQNVVDEKLNQDSLLILIEGALSGLSAQKRKIFEMSKIQGFNHDEIAETLHLSKSTVKNHLSETLKSVKKNILNSPGSDLLVLLYYLEIIYSKK